jgi:3-hydroxymyristoyl/3-hydroxydecanoyl-(acyl carrier protein) dehydratase
MKGRTSLTNPTRPNSSQAGWIEGRALEEFLPHRGMNLLIDAVRLAGEGDEVRGESTLRVSSGDEQGRDIFLRGRDSDGDTLGRVVMEPALAEHLALNAIYVMSPDMAPVEIAFFSTISKFELLREPAAGERLLSRVKRLRDKGRFRRFDGTVEDEGGGAVARGEIMAYAADPNDMGGGETGKLVAAPVVAEVRPVDRGLFPWKRPEMVFVDERVGTSEDGTQATFRYTYPSDHPFCPGHFPGNPLMMGVTQWMAACDAAACLAHERLSAGAGSPSGSLRADAEILRETGALVADVRGLVLSFRPGPGGVIGPVRVEATRKVGFRDLVRPGETIFIRVRIS